MEAGELIASVITGIGGAAAVVGGLAAWLGKVWADRIASQLKLSSDQLLQTQKFVGEIDADLRNRRIAAYTTLWKATSLLPKWPRDTTVTYEHLLELSLTLRAWYYDTGGIYLSYSTRKTAYSPLQDELQRLVESQKTGPLSETDYLTVREKCSGLRTALAGDIESRREGPIV